jgi:hypothetical protein
MASTTAGSVLAFNPRIGTSSNLESGGTYDLLLLSFPDGFPASQLLFDIDMEPRKITGLQKAAQIFLKILFSSVGSNIFYPSHGTNFTALTINANRIDSDPVLAGEIQTEIKSAASQAQAILNITGTPLDEQLASVTINGLDVQDDSATMYLVMVTMAGTTAQIATPFPQLDMQLST